MVIRALTSLKADLESGGLVLQKKAGISERLEAGARPSPESAKSLPDESETKVPAKKSRSKKSESLNGWPEQGNDDDVETIILGKKS
ncbi:Uncharacterised protein [uncultured archaeon]|nr:Uncharacterised protein [uncultured archaeon]